MRLFSYSATSYSTVSWEVVKLCIPSRLGPAETACLWNSSLSFMPCSLWNHSLLVIVSWHNAPLIHFDSVCFMFLLSQRLFLSIIYHPTRKNATKKNNCGREQRVLQRLSSAQLVRGCHLSLKLIRFGTDSCGPQKEDSEWNDLTEKFLSTHLFFDRVVCNGCFWIIRYETASHSENFCRLWNWLYNKENGRYLILFRSLPHILTHPYRVVFPLLHRTLHFLKTPP